MDNDGVVECYDGKVVVVVVDGGGYDGGTDVCCVHVLHKQESYNNFFLPAISASVFSLHLLCL